MIVKDSDDETEYYTLLHYTHMRFTQMLAAAMVAQVGGDGSGGGGGGGGRVEEAGVWERMVCGGERRETRLVHTNAFV